MYIITIRCIKNSIHAGGQFSVRFHDLNVAHPRQPVPRDVGLQRFRVVDGQNAVRQIERLVRPAGLHLFHVVVLVCHRVHFAVLVHVRQGRRPINRVGRRHELKRVVRAGRVLVVMHPTWRPVHSYMWPQKFVSVTPSHGTLAKG